jgi:hypothetical protein
MYDNSTPYEAQIGLIGLGFALVLPGRLGVTAVPGPEA